MPSRIVKSVREQSEEFRRIIHQATEWVIEYMEHPEIHPVLSRLEPGDVKSAFPEEPPDAGRSYESIFADFKEKILPGITHWNHPNFFAYFAITGSYPGILGEYLSAALNVNGMLWKTSPALTEIEELALDYLRRMLNLRDGFFGMILDTASTSSLLAIAAARETSGEFEIRKRGMAGRPELPRLVLYASSEAHSSIDKAAIALGVGADNVRKVPVDSEFRMDPSALRRMIEEDLQSGARPFCVVATVGTTSTTSIDPVRRIAAVCREFDLWLHVDAAYAGIAALVPEKRFVLDGCDEADSLVVNPHKWLATQIDLSAFYCRNGAALREAFSLVPEYLRTDDTGAVNLMDYGFQLGRRFRALKLWMVINYYGVEGLREMVRKHIRLAGMLAGWIDDSDLFERTAPTPLSTVCFRLNPHQSNRATGPEALDEMNERLLGRVNETGKVFLSHTRIRDALSLRCAIGNMRTEESHVRELWSLLNEIGREVAAA
jgi:aromatic-L-amino-acid decarboxylase